MTKTKEQKFQDSLEKVKVCSVCYKVYEGFGNNASPINIGRCCDKCNKLVIVARINSIKVRKLIKK